MMSSRGKSINPNTPGYVGQTTPVGSYQPNPWGLYAWPGIYGNGAVIGMGHTQLAAASIRSGPVLEMLVSDAVAVGPSSRRELPFRSPIHYPPNTRSFYVGFRPVLAPVVDY